MNGRRRSGGYCRMDGRCRAISYGGLGAQGLELGRTDAGDVGQVVDGGEGAVAVAVLHDARGQGLEVVLKIL